MNESKQDTSPSSDQGPAGARPAAGGEQPRRRRFWRWAGIAGVAAAVATMAACGHGSHGRHGEGWGMHGATDPETVSKRVDKAVDWVLSDLQASADQKQKVSAIARQAIGDLAPLRDKHRAARQSAMQLIAAPTLDRPAMEALRAEQMQLADQASKRFVQAIGDMAEVLTPEQRLRLKERLDKRMQGRRWS